MYTPAQLMFLVDAIDETRHVKGAIYEIGCSEGATTVFLNKHMTDTDLEKPYVCIDTFSGFVANDVQVETTQRNKQPSSYLGFRSNALHWFEYTMRTNGIARVCAIQADVKTYRFDHPISFCLLDVDLYQPTLVALNNLWPHLSEGGVVIVDDCEDDTAFDGASQAYREFVVANELPLEIRHRKLGILRKHSRPA